MSYDDYDKEFTDASLAELKRFLKWMDEKKGAYPTIIGGWAVYAYRQALGSKDIDVVMPTDRDLNYILLEEYFPANGYKVKKDEYLSQVGLWKFRREFCHLGGILLGRFVPEIKNSFHSTTCYEYFHPRYYVKEIESGGRVKEVIVDVFVGSFSKEDEEGHGIRFDWGKVLEHRELREIDGLSLYVPKIELLVFLKIVASLERASKYDKTGDGKIPSKIWKDYHDIAILASLNSMDKKLLNEFLEESNAKQYVNKFLLKYKTDYPEILKGLDMSYESMEACFQLNPRVD